MKFDFYHYVGIPTIIGALILVLYGGYLLFWPFEPLVPQVQPYEVISKEIAPGEPILYRVDVCKNTDATALVARQLVGDNGRFISLGSSVTSVPSGCSKTISATTILPQGVPPGQYHLELSITYQINALRTIVVRVQTDTFTVVAPKE
jgi:hypothetical protein